MAAYDLIVQTEGNGWHRVTAHAACLGEAKTMARIGAETLHGFTVVNVHQLDDVTPPMLAGASQATRSAYFTALTRAKF